MSCFTPTGLMLFPFFLSFLSHNVLVLNVFSYITLYDEAGAAVSKYASENSVTFTLGWIRENSMASAFDNRVFRRIVTTVSLSMGLTQSKSMP